MQSSAHASFLNYLVRRRAAITQAITASCVAEIGLYGALPPDAATQAVDGTVGILLDTLAGGDIAPLIEWVEQRILVRLNQGLTMPEALLLPAIFRRHLLALGLPAVSEQVAGASEGLLRVSAICDQAAEYIGQFYSQKLEESAASLRNFQILAESVIDGISVASPQFEVTYANPAFKRLTGYGDQVVGMPVNALLDPAVLEVVRGTILPALHREGQWLGEINYRHADGTIFPVQVSIVALRDDAGAFEGTAVVARDIREQRARDLEHARLQEEIIQMQDLALRELSTPLLAVSDQVVVMPLVGTIDSRRAQQVIETLLDGITSSSADIAILDITGVPVVDTQVANALLRAAQAVRLLGAQIVLTGIRPEVAQTLVGLGANLGEIVSRSTLQSGIAYAMGRRAASQTAPRLAMSGRR